MKEMYTANENRYDNGMKYERCGRSGVLLPKVSLGFWHNFGSVDPYERSREITHYAFDHGITHFDLANNYGPVYGSAEETMGRLMDDDFRSYRDELFISTKAGYDMWPGPYGEWGSRKYLMASLDQSLKRMHLDYVDLFYSHRFDPKTPVEENYPRYPNLSLDYAILEQSRNVFVMKCDFGWADLGTWHAIYEAMSKVEDDNVVLDSAVEMEGCRNNIIRLPKGRLGVISGLDGYIVVEQDNVLLICKKGDSSSLVKKYASEVQMKYGEEFV